MASPDSDDEHDGSESGSSEPEGIEAAPGVPASPRPTLQPDKTAQRLEAALVATEVDWRKLSIEPPWSESPVAMSGAAVGPPQSGEGT